jgi:septal ring factor EnvC (AmiA/AmiB activator)
MSVSQANWTQPGATLSHKNACKEFGIEESEIIEAIRQGRLQYKENYAHGNPYFRLLRDEVEKFAKEMHGEKTVELKRIDHEIKKTKTEINSYKRKILTLERRMQNLVQRKSEMEK